MSASSFTSKRNQTETDDFNIRQLFYPFHHFREVAPAKRIIPVFFSYDLVTKVYTFWVYEFTDPSNYNSIKLERVHSATIAKKKEVMLRDIKPAGEVPYRKLVPQANDLRKVMELVFKVHEGVDDYEGVAVHFGFDKRQSSYYREASEALGILRADSSGYQLTDVGKHFVRLHAEARNLFLVGLLSDFDLVKSSQARMQDCGELNRGDIEKMIGARGNLSGSTIPRRASSLASWLRWMADAIGAFRWEGNRFVSDTAGADLRTAVS